MARWLRAARYAADRGTCDVNQIDGIHLSKEKTRLLPPPTMPVTITVSESLSVSGLLDHPSRAKACVVLAQGAGAGMDHPFLQAFAAALGTGATKDEWSLSVALSGVAAIL